MIMHRTFDSFSRSQRKTAICLARRIAGSAGMTLLLLVFAFQANGQAAKQSTEHSSASSQLARLNVTGAWDGNFWGGSGFQLTQDGDRVWGKFSYGNG
jgi:hypothetical protein